MVVTLVRVLCGKRMIDGGIVDWSSFDNLATEAWKANTGRYRIPMNHVFGNVVHPVHVRRHDTENDAFVVTKIGNQSSVHVRRKHVGHNFAHSVAAKVLKDAYRVFQRLKEEGRRIVLKRDCDTVEAHDANEVNRVARVPKYRINV